MCLSRMAVSWVHDNSKLTAKMKIYIRKKQLEGGPIKFGRKTALKQQGFYAILSMYK